MKMTIFTTIIALLLSVAYFIEGEILLGVVWCICFIIDLVIIILHIRNNKKQKAEDVG